MILDLNETKAVESLEVKIGDKSYFIPLGNNMPLKKVKALQTEDDIMSFLAAYIPQKEVDKLTLVQFTQIMNAWSEETKKAAGINLGES
jgi:hypothetical protein